MIKKIFTFRFGLAITMVLVLATGMYFLFRTNYETTEITTTKISGDNGHGQIIEGKNITNKPNHLKTDSTVVYHSEILDSPKRKSNAAVLQWDQEGGSGEVVAAFRVFDGTSWSKWVESSSDADAKDGAPVLHSALVLAKQIHKIQYSFEVIADKPDRFSPEVDLQSASIELVDTTKGPSLTKNTSAASRILQNLGIFTSVKAHTSDPQIITRAEWGAPEPNSSDRWAPEYRRLKRVIVHHTAAASTGDSAAAVRAVWYFHANSRGWGDIGYNYLVDQSGNLFQGRYYDQDYAEVNSLDVVGGHALSYNWDSSGISALGDFTNSQPSNAMLQTISNIAGFKLYRYGVDPSGWQGDLPAVVGHRDTMQTSCPGSIHNHLPTIRSLASSEYEHYSSRPFVTSDYDVVKGMDSPTVYVSLDNQLRSIGSAGQRDCFIMAYSGRMRSVSEANIASRSVGSAASACNPPDYTWFYPSAGSQQYVLLYGGMYPVGMGDIKALGGTNKARPLSDHGIQYLHDNYVSPLIPGQKIVKGSTQPAVYKTNNDTLQHIASPDTRDCLISQLGEVKNVPDSLISSYQSDGKIIGGSASCSITTGQILHPNGLTVSQVVSGSRRYVGHPAIRDCIIDRTGTGTPYKVSQSVWDGFSTGVNAYCPYDSNIRFVKEESDPTVWRIFSDGRKKHADGFCVIDPFTTNLNTYRVWIVPNGQTTGHTYDGVFNATAQNCQAIT